MHHDERRVGAELDRKVAVGDRVERVLAQALEAELARHARAVDRETGAGERCGAERQPVDAAAALREPLPVALQHLDVSEQVMAEGDRLRDLQVREARHQQRLDQGGDELAEGVDLVAQPQAQIGGHLVVARARGMQALAGFSYERGEPTLDVEVHILGLERPLEAAALDLAADARKAALDGRKIAPGKDAAGGKHASMRKRAADVLLREALVEADRRGKALHLLVDRFLEAAGPELRLLRHAWRMQLKSAS